MPAPKSGTPGSLVPPTDPAPSTDAIDSNPGSSTQAQSTTDSSSSTSAAAPHQPDPAKKSWIEITLVDTEDRPVPGEPYEITLPDNTVASGTLDEKGHARVEGFDKGNCKITFPKLDQTVWE